MSIKLIAFDLDGTLVDSAPDIVRAVDVTLKELGLPAPGGDRVMEWVGDGVTRLLKRALTGEKDGEPDPRKLEQVLTVFRRAYGAALHVHSELYPGTLETLELLHGHLRLVCITNKSAQFTEPLLASLGIRGYFDMVVSGDTLAVLKPDPRPLLHAAEAFAVPPKHCCMVGDSRNDILAAKAAGFHAVAVSHGYHQGADLKGLGAEALLDSLVELPGWLASARTPG
ncbi:MAG TPA: phosphoglycolate phosphatase [Gammaproteobacteria bacterium]|nr:phosphoglycolate phosphatase [Gammaproteobacteria bacterium]